MKKLSLVGGLSSRLFFVLAITMAFIIAGCEDSSVDPLLVPTASLTTPAYPTGLTALNSAGSATLEISFNNNDTELLPAGVGNSGAPPEGLTTLVVGTVFCSNLSLLSPTLTGAAIYVAGCTGHGTLAIYVNAGVISSNETTFNAASSTQTVIVNNTAPTATMTIANAVSGVSSGANTAVVTFSELVQSLSSNNSGGELTVTGCTSEPSISTAMTVNGSGESVATATLSGGTCADSSTVNVAFNLDKVTDFAGNIGSASADPTPVTYSIDLTHPVATLASAQYSAGTAINSSATSTIALTFTNAASTSLVASSGTSSAPPAGLNVQSTNTASCTQVALSSVSTAGATITLGGCSGDGTITVLVDAGVALLNGNQNVASSSQSVTVQNTLPSVSSMLATNATAATNGDNTVTVTFNELVQALSANNISGEFTVSGCTTTNPSVSVAMSNDGSGHSIATATLSGGVCLSGDTVTVSLDVTKVNDLATDSGVSTTNTVTYGIP